MSKWAQIAHWITVALMGVAVIAATADGFAQSWAGLYGWAIEHGLHGWKAMAFPGLIDAFIFIGEAGLFALALEGHQLKRNMLSWVDITLPAAIAAAGWSASLAFNIGHVDQEFTDQATAAVPPIASMLGLLVLLRTLHRLVSRPQPVAGQVAEAPVGPAEVAEVVPAAGVESDLAEAAFGDDSSQGLTLTEMSDHLAGLVEEMAELKELAALVDEPDKAESGRPSGHPADGPAAGREVFDPMTAATWLAMDAGHSQRRIARQLKISRDRVKKILEAPRPTALELVPTTGADPSGH